MAAQPEADTDTETARCRLMTSADLREIGRIENRAYDFPWSIGIFKDCLRAGYRCQVIELGGVICGYGIVSTGADEGHLLNLCIDPDRRGRGLARQLLAELLTIAKTAGADTLFLEVRPSNRVARGLYQSMGFQELGVRPDYYPSLGRRREDAVMMAIAL